MKSLKTAVLLAIASTVFSANVMASGDADCGETVKADWMSQDSMEAIVVEMGYEVRKVKEEDGCYEVYAKNAEGKKFELFLNPVTGELVKAKED